MPGRRYNRTDVMLGQVHGRTHVKCATESSSVGESVDEEDKLVQSSRPNRRAGEVQVAEQACRVLLQATHRAVLGFVNGLREVIDFLTFLTF